MNNNPFDTFEIDHLSAFSINLFIQSPAMWYINYLKGIRGDTNAAMIRGQVTEEAGEEAIKNNTPVYKSIETATKEYKDRIKTLKKEKLLNADEVKEKKELENLPQFVTHAVAHYNRLGKAEYQEKIEYHPDWSPVPIIGYCDMVFHEEGIVRDLKTTAKKPSEITDSINRQLSIYSTALDGYVPLVDYIVVNQSRQEVITMEVNDVDKWISQVKGAVLAIQSLLSLGDLNEIASVIYPDLSLWIFNDEKQIAEAKKIWSIK